MQAIEARVGSLSENDFLFKEVVRLLETTKDIKIKPKYVENIPEDRMEGES